MSLERTRRKLIGALGAAAAVALAGCQRSDGDPDDTDSSSTDEADTTETAAGDEDTDSVDDQNTATDADDTTAAADSNDVEGEGESADADDEDEDTEPPVHADYETTTVRVASPDGTERGSVTAALADTPDLRYLGLSDTDELPEDRGMLFVYESVADRTFVMREMDFGIDIVYADADGTITEIHHAPEPGPDEDGNDQRYPGRGQYVLEVGYEWTVERGVREGDGLEFDLEA